MKARWGKPQAYQHKFWSFLFKSYSCILNPSNTIVIYIYNIYIWPVILYVVLDRDGYYQVLQVMTRDLLPLVFRPWWILPFSKDYDLWFYVLFRTVTGIALYMWHCVIVCLWYILKYFQKHQNALKYSINALKCINVYYKYSKVSYKYNERHWKNIQIFWCLLKYFYLLLKYVFII
jgi:hypothetical protein